MSCRLGACYAVLDHTHSSGSMLLTAQFSTLCCDPQLATNAQSVDTVCHGKQSALLLIVCACVDNAVQHGFGTCTTSNLQLRSGSTTLPWTAVVHERCLHDPWMHIVCFKHA